MGQFLRLLLNRRRNDSRPRRLPPVAPRARPVLEGLESRTLLNNRFVVPVGTPIDNMATFATLQAALTTAGLSPGDIIQIEPGSAPGNVVNANMPTVANLTIQGDLAVSAFALPQFTLSNAVTIVGTQIGFTLRNVNIGLVGAGSLTFSDNATITGSQIVDLNSSALLPLALNGTVDVLTNSTLVDNSSTAVSALLSVSPGVAGSSNLISGNNFILSTPASTLMEYLATAAVTVRDQVTNNAFIALQGSIPTALLEVAGPITGLTIQQNSFTGADTGTSGILLTSSVAGAQTTTVAGNTINLTVFVAPAVTVAPSTIGILVASSTAGVTLNATIRGNQINTGNAGNGIEFDIGNTGSVVSARVEGNDFHGDTIGVFINSTAGAALVSGIDLGGGGQKSKGGNNFRSFTTAATTTAGAIVTNSLAVQGNISAKSNMFRKGVSPESVTFDSSEDATLSDVDESSPLSDNAAFVESLYIEFLKRAGDTTVPADAGNWVTGLNDNTITPAQVVSSLIHSSEGLGLLLDGLYLKVLGRIADSGGRNSFINFLQKGGTVEQVISIMMTSAEYNRLTGSDGGFLHSLYIRLLGRMATSSEIATGMSNLQTMGRAGVVNALLKSTEFRTDVVQQIYGFNLAPPASVVSLLPPLLHRTTDPATTDVNGWVASTQDILTLEFSFAASGEFFTNG